MTMRDDCVGASSSDAIGWHGIDWATCHREVRRLQARIVKATQEGKHGRVKALQWLLTHSFSGKAIAVKRVTENRGKTTPGVDGETWSTPASKIQAVRSLSRKGYQAQPLRRVHIPKSNGKLRPLGIPTMGDRAMQALYLLALEPIAETTGDPNSFGFRPERSTADALQHCHAVLSRKTAPQWVLEADIKGCFDNINHDWLIANVPTDKAILRKWLKAGFIENHRLFATTAGTPQGGIISPTLANLTLDGLQKLLSETFPKRTLNKQWLNHKVNLVRYADDFIITGDSKEFLENEVKPLVEEFLRTRGLVLSQEKTRVTHINEGFDFLGTYVRKYKGTLLIKPSNKNVRTFLEHIRDVIGENKTAKMENLIGQLNPKIRGWANYHRSISAAETFNSVDHQIWKSMWRWAIRRHPNKSKGWIRSKYLASIYGRSGVFALKVTRAYANGESKWLRLAEAGETKIKRHVKVIGEANPFDPRWETYFEDRIGLKMKANLKGRRKLLTLWLDQHGLCPVCDQKISKETGWHLHHVSGRKIPGADNLSNLMLVHPNCHRQIHSQRLNVAKPTFGQSTQGFVEA